MGIRRFGIFCYLICLFTLGTTLGASPKPLDVYLASSHIASFFYFIKAIPLDDRLPLYLIDTHDDAMVLTGSREIRRRLLTQPNSKFTHQLAEMDAGQFIESYNWIEPLMPNPINALIWIPPRTLTPAKKEPYPVSLKLNRELIRNNQAPLKMSILTLKDWENIPWPPHYALSLDLDYFNAMDSLTVQSQMRELFLSIATHPPDYFTVAVSQPYLATEVQAGFLVRCFITTLLDRTPWALAIDPRISWGGRDRGQIEWLRSLDRTWREYDLKKDNLIPWLNQFAPKRTRILEAGSSSFYGAASADKNW